MMRDLKITEDYVEKMLTESLKGVKVKRQESGGIVLKVETEENELMETYKLKEKVKDLYIKGVKGIKQVLPVKNNTEFVIITSGSNLKDVLEIDEVDDTRTTTNDVFEVLDVLGVEAARQVIINEATKVIEDQGLDVDIRHIMLVADAMTTTGDVKGITRGGITGEKKSVLARASFETPMKHLVGASLVGEEDELGSVIENVMLNQPVPVGTGLPGLVAKMRELFSSSAKVEKSAEKETKKEKKKE
jgi:DNA-directed RNA polymerase subunit A"